MDKKIKDIKKKLLEINKFISSLDISIRATAFNILAPHYFGDQINRILTGADSTVQGEGEENDSSSFYRKFDHEKPKDNVFLITAWFYSQYGVFPITIKDINNEADNTGLTVPNRSDNTIRFAKKKGKKLFKQVAKGWQLTVNGEIYLKDTYEIKKGNKKRPEDDEQ